MKKNTVPQVMAHLDHFISRTTNKMTKTDKSLVSTAALEGLFLGTAVLLCCRADIDRDITYWCEASQEISITMA